MTTVEGKPTDTAIKPSRLGWLISGAAMLGLALPVAAQQAKTVAAPQQLAAPPMAGASVDGMAEGVRFYNEHVRPILVQNCFKCHTDEQEGGLRLDVRADILKGGDNGPAIVPHDPDASLLIKAIQQTGELKMPPKGKKLVDGDIETLVKWVKMGAPTDPHESAQPIVAVSSSADAGDEFFENKVRPILTTECGSCHMADKGGGLSMLTRESLMRGGDQGAVIIPGDPDKSLLITAVHQNTDLRMPKNGRLSDAQIADLAQWIRIGAPWPKAQMAGSKGSGGKQITAENRNWWSFQPLHEYPAPTVQNAAWAKNDIDRYVLAKLEAKGLKPSAQADKLTLIRRVSLDLTGLPPTPEEIADFKKDDSPNAYEKVVDRLLASPRYGERWARHWLDVARYADDDIRGLDPRGRGYMPMAGAYEYRDWVIKSFNADLPYDQFVRMQLAGDMMDKHPSQDMLKATSFLGGAPWIWDQAEPVQGRADERNERIDAVTRGMLGLTVACARCHDHKYDPVLQRDYYALGGVFANATYTEYNLVPEAEVSFWKERFKEIDKFEELSQDFNTKASEAMSQSYASQVVPYMVAAWKVSGKQKMPVDQAADGGKLDQEVLDRWVKFLDKPETFYPYLHDWHMMVKAGGSEDQAKELAESFQDRVYRLEEKKKELDEENKKIEIKYGGPTRRKKDAKPNEFDTYDEFCPGCTLELKVMATDDANLYTDLFQRSLSSDSERGDPGLFSFRGWALKKRLGPAEQQYMDNLEAHLKKLRGTLPEQYPFVHGMAEKKEITDIPLNTRGNPHAMGEVVPRAFPAVLRTADAKPYAQGSGRLELANDIVNSSLAMRVVTNRVWKWHFGTGIVNTPDNFGKVGDPPSDPELLDYLAISFKKDGMSIKKLQKMIVMSATYQQDSKESPEAKQLDPQNRLYSHFSLQRLDAEQVRDSILFTAGDLDTKSPGGPAKPLSSPGNHVRTVYSQVSRFRIDPFLQAFDFPVPTFTAEQRFVTNVPVQRLYFMNSSFVYQQSEALVKRVYDKGDDTARINEAYRLLFGRKPSDEELKLGLEYLKTTPDKPGYGVNKQPETAWNQYARVLYSSNEFEYLR